MSKKSAAFLHVLINRFHPGPKEKLLEKLSPREREEVKKTPNLSKNVDAALRLPYDLLRDLHSSWLIPTLKMLPEGVDTLVLSALPDPIREKLEEEVGKKQTKLALSHEVRTFILRLLAPYFLNGDQVLPIPYLPEAPLTPLLHLSKKQLTCLMDFLGIYDLAPRMRSIIDKPTLAKYEKCLTQKEKEFLRLCMNKREKLGAQPLNLKEWNGDCATLRKVLHKRGLIRMGHALCGHPEDILWHISRKLDTGRGEIILKTAREPFDPEVIRELINQIRTLMHYLGFNPQSAKVKEGTDV